MTYRPGSDAQSIAFNNVHLSSSSTSDFARFVEDDHSWLSDAPHDDYDVLAFLEEMGL